MYKEKLMEMGIPASIKGLYYLNDAITLYNECDKICYLYYKVARDRDSTATKVERCIRNAISKTNDPMKNGDFIAKYKIIWGKKQG